MTARRREESNQRVPVAITSVSGEALENAAIQRVEELRFVAPSLQISPTPFGNAVPGYTVRGQRQLEALATQDPSVVMYFADVPMMRPHGTNGAFFDIADVQVLKGPQGTLFGRNTTGGAVLVNPQAADAQFRRRSRRRRRQLRGTQHHRRIQRADHRYSGCARCRHLPNSAMATRTNIVNGKDA